MAAQILAVTEVREYIQDRIQNNHLLEGEEFGDTMINLAMSLAVDKFNLFIPMSSYTLDTFPNKAILLNGTLAELFAGQTALLARNTMSYQDGGLTIPVEERAALYQSLAAMFSQSFESMGRSYKLESNINSGWGEVSSDYARFPLW